VPEENVGAIAKGANVTFQVPAYSGRSFSGTIARPAQTLDQKTRSSDCEVACPAGATGALGSENQRRHDNGT